MNNGNSKPGGCGCKVKSGKSRRVPGGSSGEQRAPRAAGRGANPAAGHAKLTLSSRRWLEEHHSDPYVLAARKEGYRSRAAYKLLEILTESRNWMSGGLLRSGMTVVDLGAAPGGWSQVVTRMPVSPRRVVAMDLLAMDAIPGVAFIQGDIAAPEVGDQLRAALEGGVIDLLLSDISPNHSGIKAVDQARGELVTEQVLEFAAASLRPGGHLVMKLFQGTGFHRALVVARRAFAQVKLVKPQASRDRSAELYLVGCTLRDPAPILSYLEEDA